MAGQSRTLKLSILGDIDQLKKSLATGTKEVDGFAGKLGDFSKKAGLAFAAAGAAAAAYAGKLLIDGVKSAIEDEAAQAKLATTLKNVTGATNNQIKATEDYITKTALANGVTDDQLRPSLDRLLRATKDVTRAQELQSLALNIAAGTGKDLSAVSEALGKAYDGNLGALRRLGVGIDDSIIKSKDFDAAALALSKTFEGQASQQADTFQGKMARLTVAFDEAKETVGSYVLDALTPLISTFVDKGIPAITNFASNLSKTLGPAFAEIFAIIKNDVLPIIKAWYGFLADTVIPGILAIVRPVFQGLVDAFKSIKNAITDNSAELKPLFALFKAVAEFVRDDLAPILGGAFKLALQTIGNIVAGLVTGFSSLVGFITSTINKIKEFVNFVKDNPVSRFFFGGGSASGAGFTTGGGTQNLVFSGEDGTGGTTVGGRSPVIVTSKQGGTRDISGLSLAQQAAVLRSIELQAETQRLRDARESAAAARGSNTSGNTYNINVTGAIYNIGTARTIVDALNSEATSNGTFRNVGSSLLVVS